MHKKVIQELENLVKSALGIKPERGDTLTITSQPFVEEFDGFEEKWYETPWFRSTIENSLLVLLIGIVALGVVRPMLNKILVPTASTNSVMELYAEAETMAEMAAKEQRKLQLLRLMRGKVLMKLRLNSNLKNVRVSLLICLIRLIHTMIKLPWFE